MFSIITQPNIVFDFCKIFIAIFYVIRSYRDYHDYHDKLVYYHDIASFIHYRTALIPMIISKSLSVN